uniref:Uncharacterized protein MANES_16G057200 n=1 Tax=Rhizophora mucronata TaxID=61149 RepID=A0A2P2J905_RHIMU
MPSHLQSQQLKPLKRWVPLKILITEGLRQDLMTLDGTQSFKVPCMRGADFFIVKLV